MMSGGASTSVRSGHRGLRHQALAAFFAVVDRSTEHSRRRPPARRAQSSRPDFLASLTGIGSVLPYNGGRFQRCVTNVQHPPSSSQYLLCWRSPACLIKPYHLRRSVGK